MGGCIGGWTDGVLPISSVLAFFCGGRGGRQWRGVGWCVKKIEGMRTCEWVYRHEWRVDLWLIAVVLRRYGCGWGCFSVLS